MVLYVYYKMAFVRIPVMDMLEGEGRPLSYLRPIEAQVVQLEEKLRELVKESSPLEVTVTFRDDLRAAYQSFSLTNMLYKCLDRTRLHEGDYLQVIMVGEFSASGHYHLHGIMRTTPRLTDLIKRKLVKEFGRVEIQLIRYPESYISYILKDTKLGRKIYQSEVIEISKSIPSRGSSPSPAEHIDKVFREYVEKVKSNSL